MAFLVDLARLLDEGRPLLADGATGTNLFAMGLVAGDTPETWNESHPERIRKLHQDFVDAGADVILTNSFGGNARRLMLHKLEGRVKELNRAAARIAREAADTAGRPVVVAGSVGPTGDLFAPLGPITEDEAVDVFAEQMEGLAEGGADVMWIETMSAPEEMRAAVRAASRLGLPCTLTASFDTAGKTMMGLSPSALPEFAAALPTRPLAVGANCGVGASDLLASILTMRAGSSMPIIAKANCGIPQWHGDHVHYSGTPELMADYAALAVDAGASIIGGCCGTSAHHLAAMRRSLDAHHRGEAPTLDEITAKVGPLVNAPAADAQPRRGGRRRG
ncbi:MAG TPA: betaine--homocysteine S-methyltransferase [Lichenihabitans sp.]|jgi:5-methyltetrahydrofolate--homocysteine methyltransferase|nr:betaine--homocysteine S-methyltransferase [Lichenihabitans sp.]